MDGWTNGPTNRRTDRGTYPRIEMQKPRPKRKNRVVFEIVGKFREKIRRRAETEQRQKWVERKRRGMREKRGSKRGKRRNEGEKKERIRERNEGGVTRKGGRN